MAVDPVGVGVRCRDIGSGDPDVAIAITAVVAGVPGSVGVFVGWGRDAFHGARGWADAEFNLGLRDTCGDKKCAGNRGEDFVHWCYLLILLT